VVGTLRTLLAALAGTKLATKSALSQARTRLGPRPLRQLLLALSAPIATSATHGAFYKGMRLMVIDSQKFYVPDTPVNRRAFGKSVARHTEHKTESAWPLVQTIRLLEAGTHMTVDLLVKPQRNHEYPFGSTLLRRVGSSDLVLWDGGFYGYSLLKQACERGVAVLGWVGQHIIFDRIQIFEDGSYLARIYPTPTDRIARKGGLLVRVIDYTFDDPGRPGHGEPHRLITNLLDAARYPATELIVLYHQRWEIEIANDEIVTHQLDRNVDLRSQTPAGVVQELYGIHLAHNAVRALMHESALSVDLDPRQLSFIHAVRVIREAVPIMRAASTTQLPRLYAAMIQLMAQGRLPPRDGRINPRVVKVKQSHYLRKRPEHYHWPQPLRSFEHSVRVLN